MTTSEHWNTREKVEAAAEALLAEKGDLDAITAYQAAQSLGGRANSAFHTNFRQWKDRKRAEQRSIACRPSTEAMAPLADAGQRFLADFMARAGALIGETIGEFDRAANLKLVEAHHALRNGVEERNALIKDLGTTEAERDEALDRVHQLEEQLVAARAKEHLLLGRIAQLVEDRENESGGRARKTLAPAENDPDTQVPLL